MNLNRSHEYCSPVEQAKEWDAGFKVHQQLTNETNKLLEKYPADKQKAEELLVNVLGLINESNYGRDIFFTLINHVSIRNKKLATKYMKEYERIYSSKISST